MLSPETCRIVELRRYALQPGARETLIELFDRELVESQEELGMLLLGQFRDLDDPNSFVWLRGFSDMETRKRALEGFYGGPVWKEHAKAANATMLESDNVLLLRPLSTPALDLDGRPPRGATASRPGLVVVTIHDLTESAAGDFPELFAREIEPALHEAGIVVVASYVTEHSPNTFPALPVREEAEVFVWISIFEDEDDHARRAGSLPLDHAGAAEVIRLRPTARSLMHG
jgi:quinol monooxygenase YgiN